RPHLHQGLDPPSGTPVAAAPSAGVRDRGAGGAALPLAGEGGRARAADLRDPAHGSVHPSPPYLPPPPGAVPPATRGASQTGGCRGFRARSPRGSIARAPGQLIEVLYLARIHLRREPIPAEGSPVASSPGGRA